MARKKFTLIILLLIVCAACEHLEQAPLPEKEKPEPESAPAVQLLTREACGNDTCYTLTVDCAGLATRTATIRTQNQQGSVSSRGTVILTTGGSGNRFYGGEDLNPLRPSAQTVWRMRDSNYQTYEIRWHGERGWKSDTSGAGFVKAMCAYNALVRWIVQEEAINRDTVCLSGNSGGAMQIAYGMTVYQLDNLVDVAVLTGGPPTRLNNLCTDVTGSHAMLNYVLGWDDPRFCDALQGDDPDLAAEAKQQGEDDSVVSASQARDNQYDSTKMYFVEGEFDTVFTSHGRAYHDAITSEKSFEIVAEGSHTVFNQPAGAARVQSILLEHCGE